MRMKSKKKKKKRLTGVQNVNRDFQVATEPVAAERKNARAQRDGRAVQSSLSEGLVNVPEHRGTVKSCKCHRYRVFVR